jgi:hypothetical protein
VSRLPHYHRNNSKSSTSNNNSDSNHQLLRGFLHLWRRLPVCGRIVPVQGLSDVAKPGSPSTPPSTDDDDEQHIPRIAIVFAGGAEKHKAAHNARSRISCHGYTRGLAPPSDGADGTRSSPVLAATARKRPASPTRRQILRKLCRRTRSGNERERAGTSAKDYGT